MNKYDSFRKFTLLLLCFAFLPSVFCADQLTYHTDGETLTVIGCDKNASGEIVIPSKHKGKQVTSIGYTAFSMCTSISSVKIPQGVKNIGRHSFSGCTSLKKVTIPNSVSKIDGGAFSGCINLTSITIPESVTIIGSGAFSHCGNLTSITIPESVISIGEWIFYNCNKLVHVSFPANTNSIKRWFFYNCESLERVIIPSNVSTIGNEAFYNCKSLKSIIFKGSAPGKLGANVFSGVSDNAKVFIYPDATGFVETFEGLPVEVVNGVKIKFSGQSNNQFEIRFDTIPGSNYKIEVTQDFNQWSEIGEVVGTGSTVRFIDPRLPLVPFKRNYFRVKLID